MVTVLGAILPGEAGITDAHSHLWIGRVHCASPDGPVLDDVEAIAAELVDYRQAGGRTIIDCQPGGCGRDARVLHQLSQGSDVNIVACSGFHRRKYYPPEHWLFRTTGERAHSYFVRELSHGIEETLDTAWPVRAGLLKVACEATLEETPVWLLEAAAQACQDTGAAMEVHTERGSQSERTITLLQEFGFPLERVVLCHMDKRPDFVLHTSMAQAGVMLEYDTFFRPWYQPEQHVWPLLEHMVSHGHDAYVAIATDLADARMWSRFGGGPGLVGLVNALIPRLHELGFEAATVDRLVGGNIAGRLARPIAREYGLGRRA